MLQCDDWWVFELSAALTEELRNVTPQLSDDYADRWQLSADEADVVTSLGSLARRALDQEEPLAHIDPSKRLRGLTIASKRLAVSGQFPYGVDSQ